MESPCACGHRILRIICQFLTIYLILFSYNIYAQNLSLKRQRIFFKPESSKHHIEFEIQSHPSKIYSYSEQTQKNDTVETKFEPLPILSYDSNTGFGFGAKAFLLNFFRVKESLDVIVFFSTKGEKWFRTVFSIPDFELRQGTAYPLAVDLLFDYNKFVAYNFFGIGNQSSFEDKEIYTRLVIESNVMFNRGFSEWMVGQIGLKYKKIESWDFEDQGQLIDLIPDYNNPFLEFSTIYINCRFDSRDSYIHPTKGVVVQADLDWTPNISWNKIHFYQWSFWFQYYSTLIFQKTVFAARLGTINIIGDNLPIQLLIPIGSNRTLRGYPQDRFLDKSAALVNLELRFPLFSRFGGLIGADFGRVWHSFDQFSLRDWHSNAVVGLRYYMDTYVIRVDVGISQETLGIYFNFGQIF
jgi:outer membrane protein assembly factor BamA